MRGMYAWREDETVEVFKEMGLCKSVCGGDEREGLMCLCVGGCGEAVVIGGGDVCDVMVMVVMGIIVMPE